jgi:hypothetical protein
MPGLKRNLEIKIPQLEEQIEIVQYLRIIT